MTIKLALIVGTTMGNAEAVADELLPELEKRQFEVTYSLAPTAELLADCSHWLVVCSTHGAGDLPDNLHPWFDWIQQKPSLNGKKFALCGIGDSSYDTFCGALKQIDPQLRSCGMIPFVDKIEIDVQQLDLPEDQALSWLEQWPIMIR
ncbi:FMN-binding protein MioC [Ferrimonas lipolytica]|uniref:FMN-binding protein MioC n=1 Tax=Ferrimonas lipolytica TaxID=2724191 RepID=A0A6H1UK90_9GAMM|nr:FMN-binding protein MioC [Ferrimonas lipolytica]QIZ78222.1 FMN-binding protein MioC [Ferrimonas lipolytica]